MQYRCVIYPYNIDVSMQGCTYHCLCMCIHVYMIYVQHIYKLYVQFIVIVCAFEQYVCVYIQYLYVVCVVNVYSVYITNTCAYSVYVQYICLYIILLYICYLLIPMLILERYEKISNKLPEVGKKCSFLRIIERLGSGSTYL